MKVLTNICFGSVILSKCSELLLKIGGGNMLFYYSSISLKVSNASSICPKFRLDKKESVKYDAKGKIKRTFNSHS